VNPSRKESRLLTTSPSNSVSDPSPRCRVFSSAVIIIAAAAVAFTWWIPRLPAQAQEGSRPSKFRTPDDDTPREIVYPYYSLRDGDSFLVLMDRAPRPIEFRVAIHGASGQTVWSKPMTIQPQERLELNIKQLLTDLSVDYRGDFYEGSVSLHFKGPGSPLGGRMGVETPEGVWNLGPVWREDPGGQTMIPTQLNTLWWDLGGGRDALLNLVNVSSEPVAADLFLEFQGTRHPAQPLQFAPHEMKNVSVTELLAGMRLTAYKAPVGGISIVSHTPTPVLVARGKLTDPESGKVVGMILPPPQMEIASAFHASGLPISVPRADSPFAGTGNYTPHLYLRNLLDSEQTVTLTVESPAEGGTQLTPLPLIKLPGYTTQEVRLDSYYNSLPLPLPFISLRIQYNGPPGSVIGHLVDVNETNNDAQSILLANEGNGYAGSLASYWSLDDDTDFYVFLTNMGDKPCGVGFQIRTAEIEYHLTRLKLDPRETKVINLRELRDKQEPDFRGTVIPAQATEGRLYYIRMDEGPLMGRVVVLPRRK
jgi:hypothetical protein